MSVWLLVASVLLLVLAGLIRAAGTAVTRVPRADAFRDSGDGVAGAGVVARILDDREIVTPSVGVVVTGLLLLSSVLATTALVDGLGSGIGGVGVALAVALVALVLGDVVPRAVGRRKPRLVAYRLARLLVVSVSLGGWANDLLPDNDDDDEEEEAEDEGDEQERELIDSVLEFTETIVREVMTPRPDMVTIAKTASVDELIELAAGEGYSRIPVVSDDDVVGVAMVKDLLGLLKEDSRPSSVAELMRPAEFVPETKHVSTLLSEMQERHTHLTIVVDEYGAVAGLVTIEDLLEELVGEISDETDFDEALITDTASGWLVDARLPVDELEDATGIELPDEDWDTVGGLVLGLAERVPTEGEVFSIGGLDLAVVRMQGRRVSQVAVSVGRAGEVA